MADLKRLFIGKPLKSAENDEHKLSRFARLRCYLLMHFHPLRMVQNK